VLAKTSVSNGK